MFKRFFMAAGLALCIFGFGPSASPAANLAGSDPAAAIRALQKAVDTRDSDLAERHIALNELISQGVDELVPAVNAAIQSGKLRMHDTGAAIFAGLNAASPVARQTAKQLVVSETRKFVLYGIRSGSFAGKPVSGAGGDGGLFLTLGGIDQHRKEFAAAKVNSDDGRTASVSTSLHDSYNNADYPLKLTLTRASADDPWKISRIDNMTDLLSLFFHN